MLHDKVTWGVIQETYQVPDGTTCADLQMFCGHVESRLLRLLCPVTCGCGLHGGGPNGVTFLRLAETGCPEGCRKQAIAEAICADNQMPYSTWSSFWDSWASFHESWWGNDAVIGIASVM